MNQAPNQTPARNSSWHIAYEPLSWVFWVRIAQLVLTVLVLCLSAYTASQYLAFVGFAWWAVSWSIIYVPVVTWGAPRVPTRFLPNVIVLVLESLSFLWWLSTFALMATWVSAWDSGSSISYGIISSLSGYKFAKRNPYSSSSYSSSDSYSDYDDALDAAEDAADDYNTSTASYSAALGALKAATAFAAITWALFCVTLIATSIRYHRQRQEKKQQFYQTHGNPNNLSNGQATPIESDKYAQTTVNSV